MILNIEVRQYNIKINLATDELFLPSTIVFPCYALVSAPAFSPTYTSLSPLHSPQNIFPLTSPIS